VLTFENTLDHKSFLKAEEVREAKEAEQGAKKKTAEAKKEVNNEVILKKLEKLRKEVSKNNGKKT
jgi:hypothetical protein